MDDMDECVKNGLRQLRKKDMDIVKQDWSTWSKEMKSKLMFVASAYEILRDDTVTVHQKALNHGLDSHLLMLESRTHCQPVIGMGAKVPESVESVSEIARF